MVVHDAPTLVMQDDNGEVEGMQPTSKEPAIQRIGYL